MNFLSHFKTIYFVAVYFFVFFVISGERNACYRSVLSIAAHSPRVLGHVEEGGRCVLHAARKPAL